MVISALSLPESALPFTDSRYLRQVIDHLKRARLAQGVSLQALTLRAGIKPWVIDQAEQFRSIPNSRDFKAWSSALGFSWDQVWSDCFPAASGAPIEHFTSQPPFSPRVTVSRAPMSRARY